MLGSTDGIPFPRLVLAKNLFILSPDGIPFPGFVLAKNLFILLPLCLVFTRNILGFATESVLLTRKLRRGK